MTIKGWKYYNYAAIPENSPCEDPDVSVIESGEIWSLDGSPLLARWTTDFDKIDAGSWWYVIKDTPLDVSKLKAKKRYEINRGMKNFDVRPIDAKKYKEQIYDIQVAAFAVYPNKYRPTVDKEKVFSTIELWGSLVVLGAFIKDGEELKGYAVLSQKDEKYVEFSALKVFPEAEKNGINAALCAGALFHFESFLEGGGIICDGARSVSHETKFQDYLEDKFGFRKAYCKLHIAYSPNIKPIVKILYPFRKLLQKLDNVKKIHNINAVLKMESFVREQKAKYNK